MEVDADEAGGYADVSPESSPEVVSDYGLGPRAALLVKVP